MSGLPWHKRDHSARYDETRRISPAARGILSDLVDTMYRTGKAIPHDIPYLCHLCALRDKRQIEKPLDELIAAGLIVATPEGLVNKVAMEGIGEANKHIANGKKGGRPTKKAAGEPDQSAISPRSVPDRFPITPQTQVVAIEQNQSLNQNPIDKDKNKKESPLPPQTAPATVMNGHVNGADSGVVDDDPVKAIVQAFDKLIMEFWGKQAGRLSLAKNDVETAAQWLERADGDVGCVIRAIEECMDDQVNQGNRPPGSLSRYCNSVPGFMAVASRPVTLTANSPSSAGKARQGGGAEPLWMTMATKAAENWHDDILEELRRLGKEDPDRANAYAESVRELVSRPKERAAA